MKRIALLLLLPVLAYAQDTTINCKGQPPLTAMAQSLSGMGLTSQSGYPFNVIWPVQPQ